MEPCTLTLGAYSNALEMAFEANLILFAWASVLALMRGRLTQYSETADRFDQEAALAEESIAREELRRTITFWMKLPVWLWVVGLVSGALSAIVVYLMTLHGDPNLRLCGWRLPIVWLVSYTSPVSMLLMAAAGWWGIRRARKQVNRLEKALTDEGGASGGDLLERLSERMGEEVHG